MTASREPLRHLERSDPVLRGLIERFGPYTLLPDRKGSHFSHVARAILFQQLAGAAARTIDRRFRALYGDRPPRPGELLATTDAKLRGCGLSRQKIGYLRDLAAHAEDGSLFRALGRQGDDEVIRALTTVKGVGPWTAQMFLMFRLGRPDVLPTGDYGIQKGAMLAWGLRKLPSPERLTALAEPWRPYRTTACWYLWRSLDEAG